MVTQVKPVSTRTVLTLEQWFKKAEDLFGTADQKKWKFKCSHCGQSQTLQDFIDAGVENPENKFYYSCIGRWVKGRGCDWTLGGLFQIHKTEVIAEHDKHVPVFEFADIDQQMQIDKQE
jgi:hypothetical protein